MSRVGLVIAGVLLLLGARLALRPTPVARTPILDASRLIDAGGGTLEGAGAVVGVSVSVPEGALGTSERIRISSESELPAPLPLGAHATSPVVVLTKTTSARFATPVSVTIPCAPGELSGAFYWDPEHRIYRSLTVTAIDRARGTLTFETVHFTEFFTASSDLSTAEVDTGFRPDADGFPYRNGGFDLDEGGWCLGMSSLAVWYYETHAAQGEHLAQALAASRNGAISADSTSMEMARLAQDKTQGALSAKHSPLLDTMWKTHKLGGPQAGLELLNQLEVTHAPQVMILQGSYDGHAIVVYGYKKGKFLIYDSNYPGETMTYAFDGIKGFGTYARANGQTLEAGYNTLPFFSFLSLSSIGSDADFQKIFDQALADSKRVAPIEVLIDSPAVDASGNAHVPSGTTQLTISGRVEGGADFVHTVYGTDKKIAHPHVVVAIDDGAAAFTSKVKLGDSPETAFEVDGRLDKIQDAIRRRENTKKGTTVDHFTVAIYLSSAKIGNADYDGSTLEGRELLRFTVWLDQPPSAPTTPSSIGLVGALGER